jgi:uridine phosphorylase
MQVLNTNRGLWGYTGTAADGAPLTIQSTGMGGPTAAIVAEELIALGARRLVRVGTCGALVDGPRIGDLLVAGEALCEDGTSRALGAGERAAADPTLRAALARAAGDPVLVVSSDLFYDPDPERARRWAAAGAVAIEMEAAALFTVARLRGAAAGCVLLVSDELAGEEPRRIGDEALTRGELALGEAGLAGFSAFLRAAGARLAFDFGFGLAAAAGRPEDASTSRRSCSRGTCAGCEPSPDASEPSSTVSLASWDSIPASRSSAPLSAGRLSASSRWSRRSTPSSIPSSRCETERRRRVSRSMSAAEGMLSAPIAASCAWTARSRASNAREIAPLTNWFSSRSWAILPSASSLWRASLSRRPSLSFMRPSFLT